MRSSPSGRRRFPPSTTCRRRSSRSSARRDGDLRRRSSSIPTTTWAVWSTRLKDLEILDDTLIYYIIGDNGASAEGTPNGCFNEIAVLNGMGTLETPEFLMSKIDDFGGPEASNHYAVGWAHAMNTPYQWTKQVASHFGGTRNGTIVHWPNGIKAKGEVRSQFHHVIDVAPTVLEAAGIPAPTMVNGIQQAPHRRRQHAVCVQRRQGGRAARDPVLRDVRQPRHLPQGLDRGHPARRPLDWYVQAARSTRMSGSSTTPTPTGASRRTSPRRIRRNCTSFSGCS